MGSTPPWKSYAGSIYSANIEEGVSALTAAYMFQNCSNLGSVDLSGLDTSAVTSMLYMFSGCKNLASINWGAFDTSKVTDMVQLFYGCSSLTSLDLSSFDTSKANSMDNMFGGCTSLTTITLGNKFSFYGLKVYQQCTLPTPSKGGATGKWVSSVDNIAYEADSIPSNVAATYTAQTKDDNSWVLCGSCIWRVDDAGCLTIRPKDGVSGTLKDWKDNTAPWESYASSITSVNIEPGVSAATTKDMFSGFSKLNVLDLQNLDTLNVKDFSSMFAGCSKLETINISQLDFTNAQNISALFRDCLRIVSLDLESLNTSSLTNMSSLFEGCSKLESINFGALDTSAVTDMSFMFGYCTKLKQINLSTFNTQSVTNMSGMFYECTLLESINVSNFNTEKVSNFGSMFDGCSSLESLDLSNFNTLSATYMKYMFPSIDSITLGENFSFEGAGTNRLCSFPTPSNDSETGRWISSADGIAYEVDDVPSKVSATYTPQREDDSSWARFGTCLWSIDSQGCLTIKPLPGNDVGDLGGWNIAYNHSYYDIPWNSQSEKIYSVKFEGSIKANACYKMFAELTNLRTANLNGLDTSSVTDMSYMFYSCPNLYMIDFSNIDTSCVTNMSDMFAYSYNLKELLNLSSFDTSCVTNMSNMFDRCSDLKNLDLSSFDTSAVTSMDYMFGGLDSLTCVTLGKDFSFCGRYSTRLCSLPSIQDSATDKTLHWINKDTGVAYTSDDIPDNISACYILEGKTQSKLERLYGSTRYDTMLKIADEGFETTSTVLLASGENFPDALTVTALAGYYKSPVLLTASQTLSSQTWEGMNGRGHGTEKAIIAGGIPSISERVSNTITNGLGKSVERIAGSNRAETALKIYEAGKEKNA